MAAYLCRVEAASAFKQQQRLLRLASTTPCHLQDINLRHKVVVEDDTGAQHGRRTNGVPPLWVVRTAMLGISARPCYHWT